ncbi:MAG: trypsin-like peptidase domain-containing protein [Alphaproteobacteria bacterium]|nr:trypsin-like peptidase domain-containing protein [Alphaproteobacteria bacterium]
MRRAILFLALLAFPAAAAKPPPLGVDEVPAPRAAPAPNAGGRANATGTGFVVAPGRLLTNAHVVQGCTRVTARNSANQTVAARIGPADARRDLAILSVPDGFGPPLSFRETPPVRRGDQVVTYGFPLTGLLSSGPTLTTGDVSALAGLRDNPLHFQISAPVQPGNSGGPLLDAQGNIVGVVTSKLNAARVAQMTGGDIPQNINFAVKGSEALAFLTEQGVHPWRAASTGADRRPAEIGDIANPSTAFLACYR